MSEIDDATMEEIRAFIGAVEWRYAKTMPQWPHFYNVLKHSPAAYIYGRVRRNWIPGQSPGPLPPWNPDKKDGFFRLVSAIFNNGYKEAWPRPPERSIRVVIYFNVDGYRYWVMDTTVEGTTLINRAKN